MKSDVALHKWQVCTSNKISPMSIYTKLLFDYSLSGSDRYPRFMGIEELALAYNNRSVLLKRLNSPKKFLIYIDWALEQTKSDYL